MRRLLLSVVLCLGWSGAARADTFTAEQLYDLCKTGAEEPGTYPNGFCSGYFLAFTVTLPVSNKDMQKKLCYDDSRKITVAELRQQFMDYYRPEHKDFSSYAVVYVAMKKMLCK